MKGSNLKLINADKRLATLLARQLAIDLDQVLSTVVF